MRQRIHDYAFLSDSHAPALVSRDGSVDWWCPPRADHPPVFGRILDPHAGHWSLTVKGGQDIRRRYLPQSLVVESIVTTTTGEVRIRDGLAMEPGARGHEMGLRSPHVLLRSVEGVRGTVQVRTEFAPRFEYGLTTPHLRRDGEAVVAEAGRRTLRLWSPAALEERDSVVGATFTVAAGDRTSFAASYAAPGGGALAAELGWTRRWTTPSGHGRHGPSSIPATTARTPTWHGTARWSFRA